MLDFGDEQEKHYSLEVYGAKEDTARVDDHTTE
jgi:hypothetical protein